MFAILKTGGKQFYVQKGDIIEAEITSQDIGAEVTIDDVLLISDSTNVISDPTQLKSAKVKAKILSFVKGKKVKVFKNDTLITLKKRVLKQEHIAYPLAIAKIFANL